MYKTINLNGIKITFVVSLAFIFICIMRQRNQHGLMTSSFLKPLFLLFIPALTYESVLPQRSTLFSLFSVFSVAYMKINS